jgi:hypothetical protein
VPNRSSITNLRTTFHMQPLAACHWRYGHTGGDIRRGIREQRLGGGIQKRLDGLKRPASVGIGVVEEY